MEKLIAKDLETEILDSTSRISERSFRIEESIGKLNKKIETYTTWAWGFVWFGFAVAILGVILYVRRDSATYNLNLLGDFFGGSVASVWSLAGLFFIYIAFLGQKQQLLNQQLEIMYSQLEVKYTRLELEGQKNEMIEQNNTLRRQRFENTFFQLLHNHQEIVRGIDIRRNRGGQSVVLSQGRDCFKSFYEIFRGRTNNSLEINEILTVYMNFYNEHQSDLGHYFRHMYHILKLINNATEIEESEKFKYTSLLRALMSSYELAMLFYSGLADYGVEYFKPLIEKFSFLKNLDDSLIISPSHFKHYDELAFAGSKRRQEILLKRNSIPVKPPAIAQ